MKKNEKNDNLCKKSTKKRKKRKKLKMHSEDQQNLFSSQNDALLNPKFI